jgi:hypothetical protein
MHTGRWGMWSLVTEAERRKGPGQANRNNAADKLPFHSNNKVAWVVVSRWEQTEHGLEQECILCNAACALNVMTLTQKVQAACSHKTLALPPPPPPPPKKIKFMSVDFSCALFSLLDFLTFEDGADGLCRIVGNKLPLCAEQYLRRLEILTWRFGNAGLGLTLHSPVQGSPSLARSSSALHTWI